VKRLDQIKDDLEQFDRQETGESTLHIDWDFREGPTFSGSFYSGADTGRPPMIEFNYPTIERWFRTLPPGRALRRLTGLNFHELGHALYTPRDRESWDYSLARAFNTLEDQRIERLIIERFPESERSLKELLTGEENPGATFAHGRPHVPEVDRRFYDRRFAQTYGPAALETLDDIISTYVGLCPGTPLVDLTTLASRLEALLIGIGARIPYTADPFDSLTPPLH
jgi:hypothetical protein